MRTVHTSSKIGGIYEQFGYERVIRNPEPRFRGKVDG